MMKNKLWVKILVPTLIVVAIGAIWIVKNAEDKANNSPTTSQNRQEKIENQMLFFLVKV